MSLVRVVTAAVPFIHLGHPGALTPPTSSPPAPVCEFPLAAPRDYLQATWLLVDVDVSQRSSRNNSLLGPPRARPPGDKLHPEKNASIRIWGADYGRGQLSRQWQKKNRM